jgi:hypothetical protein
MSAPNKEWLPVAVLKDWFDEILDRTDPRPSDVECERLIWKLRIHFNQQQNTELKRPISEMRDANPNDILNSKVEKVVTAANVMFVAVRELEEFSGNYTWQNGSRTISLWDVEEMLWRIGAFGKASEPQKVSLGRPITGRRSVAKRFADEIRSTLQNAGYLKRLSKKDPESLTSFLGAKAYGWAYSKEITPKGFVDAVLARSQKKSASK